MESDSALFFCNGKYGAECAFYNCAFAIWAAHFVCTVFGEAFGDNKRFLALETDILVSRHGGFLSLVGENHAQAMRFIVLIPICEGLQQVDRDGEDDICAFVG